MGNNWNCRAGGSSDAETAGCPARCLLPFWIYLYTISLRTISSVCAMKLFTA